MTQIEDHAGGGLVQVIEIIYFWFYEGWNHWYIIILYATKKEMGNYPLFMSHVIYRT